MATPLHPLDKKRLWLVSFVSILIIVVVGYIVSGPGHVGSPVGVRLLAAVIVTAFAVVANFLAGPRAAAATAVVGVLVAVVLLGQVA